jgi:DNA-binding CsgD family transcriptional regulator
MGANLSIRVEQLYKQETLAAARLLDVIMASVGPVDLCKQIVHSDFSPDSSRGCQLYYLDGKSVLRKIASYGQSAAPDGEITAWDDSPLSEAIREKSIRTGAVLVDQTKMFVVAIPFVSNSVPTGLMALVLDDLSLKMDFSVGIAEVFSKIGAFYLVTLDFGSVSTGSITEIKNIEDLTSRQLLILTHIDHNLVNLEIAKMLMLSESTIRQETVKIYRALGVSNRAEAASKARTLGLIPKRSLATSN